MKKTLFSISLMILSLTLYAGGGWPQTKGSFFFKLSQWWVKSDQHFNGSGGKVPHTTRSIYNTSIYMEYGITDRLTGIIYFPFVTRSVLNQEVGRISGKVVSVGDEFTGIGDTDLAIKYGLTPKSKWAVSASLVLGLPLGKSLAGKNNLVQTGDGEFNQMLQLDVSRGLKIGNFYPYFSVNAAFNNRTKGFSDEFRYGLETGLTKGKFTAIFRLYGIKSFKNGSGPKGEGATLFANNTEFLTFSPEIAFSITEKFGISATYATALSGKLIFANPSYSAGVFLKL